MMSDLRGANRVVFPAGHGSRWQSVRIGAVSLSRGVRAAVANVVTRLFDALVWFLLLMTAGAAMLVAGTYVLVGVGWALIVSGVLCICAASFIRKGMTGG